MQRLHRVLCDSAHAANKCRGWPLPTTICAPLCYLQADHRQRTAQQLERLQVPARRDAFALLGPPCRWARQQASPPQITTCQCTGPADSQLPPPLPPRHVATAATPTPCRPSGHWVTTPPASSRIPQQQNGHAGGAEEAAGPVCAGPGRRPPLCTTTRCPGNGAPAAVLLMGATLASTSLLAHPPASLRGSPVSMTHRFAAPASPARRPPHCPAPLLQRAQEVERAEPKVAYYCRMYALEQASRAAVLCCAAPWRPNRVCLPAYLAAPPTRRAACGARTPGLRCEPTNTQLGGCASCRG